MMLLTRYTHWIFCQGKNNIFYKNNSTQQNIQLNKLSLHNTTLKTDHYVLRVEFKYLTNAKQYEAQTASNFTLRERYIF